MSIQNHSNKIGPLFKQLPLFIFLVASVLALIYYKERVIFLDGAFKFFEITAQDALAIQANRFGDIFSQGILWISTMIGCSIQSSLIVYSLSYITYGLFIYLVIRRYLHYKSIALLIPLMLILISSHSFFWFTNEQYSAFPILILSWSIFLSYNGIKRNKLLFIFGLVTLTLSLWTHPLMIISHSFIWFYLVLSNSHLSKKQLVIIALISFFSYWLKSIIWDATYDNESYSRFTLELFFKALQNLNTIGARQFLDHLLTDLFVIPILLILSIFIHIRYQKYIKALTILISSVGYCIMNIIANENGGAWYHVETHYLPLTTILVFPLLFELQNISRLHSILVKSLLISLTVFKMLHILFISDFYKDRLDNVRYLNTLSKTSNHILLNKNSEYLDSQYQYWALAYETMLLSTIENDVTKSVLVVMDKDKEEWRINDTDKIMGGYTNYARTAMRSDKFNFQKETIVHKYLKEE